MKKRGDILIGRRNSRSDGTSVKAYGVFIERTFSVPGTS